MKGGVCMSSILMTTEEVRELKQMCNDPLLELGMTLRPMHLECLKSRVATNHIQTIILFEKHENSEKWNTMHKDRIRLYGHLATITLAVLVQMISGNPMLSIAVGSTSGILKDEVQARVWYPKVFKGWVLTRHFNFSYEQYPRQHLFMSWTDIIQDETGNEVEKKQHGQSHITVGGSFGVPEKLVRQIMTSYPLHTIKFK
jgi:hypothetical protein